VNGGLLTSPWMGQLRKAAVCFATANLLERVRDDKRVVEILRGGG
jgi:hypothetical protein